MRKDKSIEMHTMGETEDAPTTNYFSGRFLYFTALTSSLSSFSFGFNIGATNKTALVFDSCIPIVQSKWSCFHVSQSDWGIMSSMMYVGALIGSLGAGHLSASYGRLISIKTTSVFYIIGLLLFAFAVNYWMLFFGRFIIGLGVGMTCVVVPMYLMECSSVEKRGGIVFFHPIGIVSGILVVEALGLIVGVEGGKWRWLIVLNALLMVSQSFFLFWCKESPKYTTASTGQGSKFEPRSWFKPEARKSLLLAMFLHFAQQMCCINGVFLFSAALFKGNEYIPLWIALLNLVMTIVSMSIIEKGGRRVLLLGSLAGMTVAAFALSWVQSTQLTAAAVLMFVATYAIGLGPIPWIVMSELFPTSTVSMFVPLAVSTNWICNALVAASFLSLKHALGEKGLFFGVGIVCALLFATSWMIMVETKGRAAGYV